MFRLLKKIKMNNFVSCCREGTLVEALMEQSRHFFTLNANQTPTYSISRGVDLSFIPLIIKNDFSKPEEHQPLLSSKHLNKDFKA